MRKLFLLSAVLIASAAGCGGGGGSSPAPPPPTPAPTAVPQPFTSGGTIPSSGQAIVIPNTNGLAVLITLPAISTGAPASGAVFYSTTTSFAGLTGAPPDAPAFGGNAPALYADIRLSTSTPAGSGVALSAQPTFTFTLPAGSPVGPYWVDFYDTSVVPAAYATITGPVSNSTGTIMLAPKTASPITLMPNQNYVYVLHR